MGKQKQQKNILENLRRNFKSIVKFEEAHGNTILNAFGISGDGEETKIDFSNVRFGTVARVVWAGRLRDDKNLTEEQNLEDIADENPADVIKAATQALAASISDGTIEQGGDSETAD